MKTLSSEIFIDILKGKYYKGESEFSRYYVKAELTDEVIVTIKDVQIDEGLDLESIIHFPYRVKIIDCVFANEFILSKVVFDKEVVINNSRFYGIFSLRADINGMSIYNSEFENGVHFNTGRYRSVSIGEIKTDSIDIFGGIFDELSIDGKDINSITIVNEDTFIDDLQFGHRIKNTNIKVDYVTLNSLHLSGQYLEDCSVAIENVVLHTISMDQFKNSQHLLFHDIEVVDQQIEVSNIKIGDFYKECGLTDGEINSLELYGTDKLELSDDLYKLKLSSTDKYFNQKEEKTYIKKSSNIKPSFTIFNVVLGNCDFKNVQLENFNEIFISDTELTSIKTFNSTFPTKNVVGNFHSLYEIFNDLYSVAQKKNNKREQADYYQASKNALLKSYLNKNWYRKIPSIVSLSFSKFYSNYGNRWTQAVFLTIPLVSISCFCCMLLLTKYDIELSQNGWDNFRELLPFYFRFIDITHKINFMDDVSNGIIYSKSLPFIVFDLIGRILIAIGIFETVLAFRKYVRK